MKRIKVLLKAILYKIKYGKSLKWNGMLRCSNLSEIKIMKGSLTIGTSFSMKPGSYIAVVDGGSVTIGDRVNINRNTMLICHDSITVGERCSFGPNVMVYDHDHRFGMNGMEKGYKTAPITIEKNCWIGAGVIILRGTHIGEGCVIGAGTVVKGNIPAHSVVKSEGNRNLLIEPIRQ